MSKQTLKTLTRKHCCNLVDADCLGVALNRKKFRDEGECWILKNEVCVFFSKYVLPLDIGLIGDYTKLKENSRKEQEVLDGKSN